MRLTLGLYEEVLEPIAWARTGYRSQLLTLLALVTAAPAWSCGSEDSELFVRRQLLIVAAGCGVAAP